jgi:hypothetical protein
MEITRDLFPTDDRSPYLTLTLASRDLASHNLLTSLTAPERERIAEALSSAGAAIVRVLRAREPENGASRGSPSFGCGT